jgi:hypothetical protein
MLTNEQECCKQKLLYYTDKNNIKTRRFSDEMFADFLPPQYSYSYFRGREETFLDNMEEDKGNRIMGQ